MFNIISRSFTVGIPSKPKEKVSIFNFLLTDQFATKEASHNNIQEKFPSQAEDKKEEEELNLLGETEEDSANNYGLKVCFKIGELIQYEHDHPE